MTAHHGMGTDNHIVLDGRAAKDSGAPPDENVVANSDWLLIAQDLTRFALDYGPAVVMSQDSNGPREVNVVADCQKVRVGDVDVRVAGAMERDVLTNSDTA